MFWRLYHRPLRGAQVDHLRGWLYRVATNLGLNAIRSESRRRHYERMAGISERLSAAGVNPEAEAERTEEREQVRQVLARLKPKQAKLLILRYSGFSYVELAAALEIAPGSVGTLLARAARAFERQYRELGFEVQVRPHAEGE